MRSTQALRRRLCRLTCLCLGAGAVLAAAPAFAHTGVGVAGGLATGFFHPLTGLDHVVAMVAVGLWGAQLGRPALWMLPIAFPLVMTFGAILGIAGVPIPLVEPGIALSAVVLGLMVASVARPPLWVAAVLVGIFAVFHGYAHGQELPQATNPLAYGLGFVIATGSLHLCGILIGLLTRWPSGVRAVQGTGACIAAIGGYTLATAGGLLG